MRDLAYNVLTELNKKKSQESQIDFLEHILTNLAKRELTNLEIRELEEISSSIKWHNDNFLTKHSVMEAIRKWWIKHPDITELVRELELNNRVLIRKDMRQIVISMLDNGELKKTEMDSVDRYIK